MKYEVSTSKPSMQPEMPVSDIRLLFKLYAITDHHFNVQALETNERNVYCRRAFQRYCYLI